VWAPGSGGSVEMQGSLAVLELNLVSDGANYVGSLNVAGSPGHMGPRLADVPNGLSLQILHKTIRSAPSTLWFESWWSMLRPSACD